VADPNAQFAIDIAASMPAGEVTLAQLDELTAKLMGGGKNADHFQRAILQVSTALDAAKAASVAANTALADGETRYRELERAAVQSAKAAERAAQKNGGVIPADLVAKAAAADAAVKAHAATLAVLEREANDATAAETRLGTTLGNVRKLNAHVNTTLAQSSERLSKLQGALGGIGGPLGRLGQLTITPIKGFTEMSQSMGAMGAAATLATVGVVAVAAALLASAAAAAVSALAIARWAVKLSDKAGNVERQATRLQENFESLFSGLSVDPVVEALERIANMFDATSETGATIKFLFETIFQPLIDQAENAAVVVEAFAIGFLIGLLKLYIAAKPIIKAIAEFFGFDDPALGDTLALVTKAAEYAAFAFAAVVAVFGALAAAVAVVVAIVAGPTVAAFLAVTAAVNAVINAVAGVVSYLRSVNLAEIGSDMMRGLAAGITGAAGFLVDAIRNAINGAIKSAKSLLGIASPSKVFAGIGEDTGEGFERGVDRVAPDAQSALANMVSPLAAQDAVAAPGATPAPVAAGASTSVNVPGATFNFYGVKDAEDAASRWGEWLTRVLEGDAAQLGGEAAPT
jgi:hypothetical protein